MVCLFVINLALIAKQYPEDVSVLCYRHCYLAVVVVVGGSIYFFFISSGKE